MPKDSIIKSSRFIHRDISWLYFNYRVLQEAKDLNVPLFERLKFLAIYSSNLDEFFRVRVANHRNLLRVGKKTMRQLDYDPEALLLSIQKLVSDHAVNRGTAQPRHAHDCGHADEARPKINGRRVLGTRFGHDAAPDRHPGHSRVRAGHRRRWNRPIFQRAPAR